MNHPYFGRPNILIKLLIMKTLFRFRGRSQRRQSYVFLDGDVDQQQEGQEATLALAKVLELANPDEAFEGRNEVPEGQYFVLGGHRDTYFLFREGNDLKVFSHTDLKDSRTENEAGLAFSQDQAEIALGFAVGRIENFSADFIGRLVNAVEGEDGVYPAPLTEEVSGASDRVGAVVEGEAV